MAQHILLKHATRRPYRDTPELPEGAVYDPTLGFWILADEPLVRSTQFCGEGGRPVSKKCDHETGEDQKGE